jgi:protein transport protein SEC13
MNKNFEIQSSYLSNINSIKYSNDGKRLATCNNDGKIYIFSIEESNNQNQINKNPDCIIFENGHSNSIWDISFSNSELGNFLASCGNDNKLIIWYENSKNNFQNIYTYNHQNSINSCEFCPKEYGIILLCCSSDSSISLHELKKDNNSFFSYQINNAHEKGVNCINWGPSIKNINFDEDDNNINNNNNLLNDNLMPLRFVSCGVDGKIILWISKNNNIENFNKEIIFNYEHAIKCISWLNYIGYANETIAFGTDDGFVKILKFKIGKWICSSSFNCQFSILKIFWSSNGSFLSVSNGKFNLFLQENMDEKLEEVNLKK